MYTLRHVLLVMFGIGLLTVTAAAQVELPSGQEVVDRFVELSGGKEKYQAVKSMTVRGKYRLPQLASLNGADEDGSIEIYFSQPDKARVNVDIPNFGKVEKGRLGKVAWETHPLTGARLLDTEESERFLAGIDLRSTYDPASMYESLENAGVEDVEGEACYKVTMKRKESDEVDVTYYSVKTGLPVKAITHEPTQVGKLTVKTRFSDYEEAGGITSAMKMTQELVELGMTQEIAVESIQYNEPIDDKVFELPEAVERLVNESE